MKIESFIIWNFVNIILWFTSVQTLSYICVVLHYVLVYTIYSLPECRILLAACLLKKHPNIYSIYFIIWFKQNMDFWLIEKAYFFDWLWGSRAILQSRQSHIEDNSGLIYRTGMTTHHSYFIVREAEHHICDVAKL